MKFIESVLNEEDTHNDYPAAAKKNAQMAIDWKEEHGRDEVEAGTPVGWARAHQLAKGENLSTDTVKRMSAFNRHRKNSSIKPELKETPWKDRGYVAWLIWGGDEGVDWAIEKSKEIDAMEESNQLKYIKPINEAENYITDKFKVGDKIKTGFGEWEVIETDYAPKKRFTSPFIFKGDDMKRLDLKAPPTNKQAVGYKVTDGDKYPIIGFLYQYKDITKLATIGVDESVTEKLTRGLKPLLTIGSTITKKAGEDALLDLSDKFDRIDDEYAGTIASWLDMAIELMQDRYAGDATKKLKQFNKACKDVLNGKEVGSAFESVTEAESNFETLLGTSEDESIGRKIRLGGKRDPGQEVWQKVDRKNWMNLKTKKKLDLKKWAKHADEFHMAGKDLQFESKVNEASRRKVHKAAKQGSYPAVIVVVQDGKVIHQEPVSTPDIAPATFNVMQEKYPKAVLHLEDNTGKRLFTESVNEMNGFQSKALIRAVMKEAKPGQKLSLQDKSRNINFLFTKMSDNAGWFCNTGPREHKNKKVDHETTAKLFGSEGMAMGIELDGKPLNKFNYKFKGSGANASVDGLVLESVNEAKAYKLKASEFGGDTHSAAYNVKGEPTWRVHSTYAIDQVSGENNPEERDVVFFEAMPINNDIYIKIGGINNLKRANGSTVGENFGTTIEEWKKDPKGIAKEASEFLTDATHLKWINKKARSEGQVIKWALKDDYSSVIEDLVNKSLGLAESAVTEGKMPDKLTNDDDIVFLKTSENSKGAHYNVYYKGHDIDFGGVGFGTEKQLNSYAKEYILSRQWYNKLRYEDAKPLPESVITESSSKHIISLNDFRTL